MPRKQTPTQMIIQFDNSFQPPAYGAAALLSSVTVAMNEMGQAITQPAFSQVPMVAEDITDDLLQQINDKLALVGLTASRV